VQQALEFLLAGNRASVEKFQNRILP